MLSRLTTALLIGILSASSAYAGNKKAEALQSLSRDAYIWGYPAVLMKHTREAMLEQTPRPEEAVNHFFHSSNTPEMFFKNFIPTNSENLYSWAWVDLSEEPLIFTQPAISNRYFSVQFVDVFTNVFQVISNENFSGKAATFALTSPTWKGELPAGVVRIKSTTPEAFILAQTHVRGAYELASVAKLNNQLQLITLSNWNRGIRKDSLRGRTPTQSFQAKNELATLGSEFLTELFEITAKNTPPTGADTKQWQNFSKRLSSFSADQKVIVERGLFAGARQIEDRIAQGFGAKVNGWSYQLRAEPFREDYLVRAAVAATTLFSTPAREMTQLKAVNDSEDRQLYSNYKYVIHFKKGEIPPTPTSWTLRVFETGSKKLGNVPVEKARLNDQMAILKYNVDGSMDIRLQEETPEKDRSNWLRLSQDAGFFVALTIYNPNNSVLNRKYVAPAITRVEDDGLPRPRIVRTMMAESPISKRDTAESAQFETPASVVPQKVTLF